jgi:tetratricopeptide (TPR) repeat protein
MRKRSDDDPDKYNQLVVADDQEVEHEYKNAYRGRVQNRQVDMDYMPMYGLSLEQAESEVKSSHSYDRQVEAFNLQSSFSPVYVSCDTPQLDEAKSKRYFAQIDTLTVQIARLRSMQQIGIRLLLRAVSYAAIQNYEGAIDDLSTYLQMDSTSALAYWQRAVCQSRINEFQASQGTNVDMMRANVLSDLTRALDNAPQNAYLYYDRANVHAQRRDYAHAIEDYSRAIELDPQLAEAYYNRGLVRIYMNQNDEGIADLSKAGELGLYQAYSIIKKYRK